MKVVAFVYLLYVHYVSAAFDSPVFHNPPPAQVDLPDITPDDITEALNYAKEQHEKKMELENNYISSGGSLPPDEVTAERRQLSVTSDTAMSQHRIQEQLEDASKFLANKLNLKPEEISALQAVPLPEDHPLVKECQEHLTTAPCDASAKFRTADGSCNNLKNPNWGRSYAAGARLTKNDFSDGIMSPRTSKHGYDLPNPRVISQTISPDVSVTSRNVTHFIVAFSQLLTNEMTQISSARAGDKNEILKCCPTNSNTPVPTSCISVEVPEDDILYLENNQDCIAVTRSTSFTSKCLLGSARLPVQQQTAFIDASQVYGASEEQMGSLRTLEGGLLKSQTTDHGELLPPHPEPESDLCTATLKKGNTCFMGGDYRVNYFPGVLGLHTLAVRQHNKIARTLAADNPDKTDEELFQESRRIIIAMIQAMTYREFLLVVLGSHFMEFFDLNLLKDGFTEYDPSADPTVPVAFNTGAYRTFHSSIQNLLSKVDPAGLNYENMDAHTHQLGFFQDDFYEGDMDAFVRGYFYQKAQASDRYYGDSYSSHCLRGPDEKFGVDLPLLEVQRGRDHGLPSYPDMVEYVFGERFQSFDDLKPIMTESRIDLLKSVYKSIDDVDYYIGGLLETHVDGAMVGPTFASIIGKHFHNIKFGDRFYFEHGDQAGSFTPGQLEEIRKTTLSSFVCENSDDMGEITPTPLLQMNDNNALKPCDSFPKMDLSNWYSK